MSDCPLKLNAEGFFECPDCHWVFKRKADKPPRRNCPKLSGVKMVVQQGPGTELKKLLKRLRVKVKANCACNKRTALMDQRGVDWCEKNIELIVDWLEEEADKRGILFRNLPFKRVAAKRLVNRAIQKARKLQKA